MQMRFLTENKRWTPGYASIVSSEPISRKHKISIVLKIWMMAPIIKLVFSRRIVLPNGQLSNWLGQAYWREKICHRRNGRCGSINGRRSLASHLVVEAPTVPSEAGPSWVAEKQVEQAVHLFEAAADGNQEGPGVGEERRLSRH
jgi:hypothetical protein